jgi:serine/threonine-protein phosphatase 2A regulatory subunit B''
LLGFLVAGSIYVDTFLGLDKDMNGTLSKEELQAYADGTLTEIFIERGMFLSLQGLL